MAGIDILRSGKTEKTIRSRKAAALHDGSVRPAGTPVPDASDEHTLAIWELRQQYDDIRRSLQKNEYERAWFWKIFDHAGIAAIVIDDTTTIVRANRQFEILASCRRSEIEGRTDWAWFLPGSDPEILRKIDTQLRRGPLSAARQVYLCRMMDRKKNIADVEVTITRIPKTPWSLAFIRETGSFEGSGTHERSEPASHAGSSRAPGMGVLITDRYGRIIHLNEVAERMTGWTEREVAGRPALEVLKPRQESDKPITESLIQEYTDGNKPASRVRRRGTLLTKGRERHPVSYTILPLRAQERNGTGYVVEFADMSVKGSAPATVPGVEEGYRLLLRNPREIIYSLDEAGRIVFVSSRVEMLGYLREEVIGRRYADFIHPDDRGGLERQFVGLQGISNRHFSVSFRIRTPDNGFFWAESTGTIRPSGAEHGICLVGVLRNISEYSSRELALMEVMKKAPAADSSHLP